MINKGGDKTRFKNHMENEHSIVFEIGGASFPGSGRLFFKFNFSPDFLFAVCRLEPCHRESIREYVETVGVKEGNSNTETGQLGLRRVLPTLAVSNQEKCSLSQSSAKVDGKEDSNQSKTFGAKVEIKGEYLETEEIEFLSVVPAAPSKETSGQKRKASQDGDSQINVSDEPRKVQTPSLEEDLTGPKEILESEISSSSQVGPAGKRRSLMLSCDQCDQKLGSRSGLYSHKRRKHPAKQSQPKNDKQQSSDIQPESVMDTSGDPQMSPEEEEITKRILLDNEDSDDEDDMEILSENIIMKYDGEPLIKKEAIEHDDDLSIDSSESKEAGKALDLMKRSKFFMENKNMFHVCSESEAAKFPKPLKFLPGWRVKTLEVRRSSGQAQKISHFLSPEDVQLNSGISVLEYLRINDYSKERIELTIRKMKFTQKTLQDYKTKYGCDL